MTAPVLIIGGSGIVGARAARTLHQLHPSLPIVLGARDLEKAGAVAREIDPATVSAARIDLSRPGLGLPADARFSAVAVFLKDDTLNSLKYAQAHGLPYMSVSSGTFELGPEVAHYIHRPQASAVLLGSQWLAGAATLPILQFVREFASVDAIRIGVLLDEQDMGGPAAYADYERIIGKSPHTLVLSGGQYRWIASSDNGSTLVSVDGVPLPAQPYAPFDVISLGAATGARDIRLDIALGESASRRRGAAFSTEIIIEISGRDAGGAARQVRHELVHPAGQAALTALGVALGIERLLGLDGRAAPGPGLYFPETLIEPRYMLERLRDSGAILERQELAAA
ncbi:NAD(P)-dependent oxidoreductase [Massilia sp. BJB1822]|uniref:NAD(P)-dependent oxidoreductase n=1 Tax=Massilia sp. BJB1822 TaxID=2744470 RepID=UPI001593C7FB|nr:NAD(P)-dependent oxidoreductase [Massilia sp. BJB1822]NVD97307.1 NAD(P)-dependent oxidoreductase [Massilia sp. BJB1822]